MPINVLFAGSDEQTEKLHDLFAEMDVSQVSDFLGYTEENLVEILEDHLGESAGTITSVLATIKGKLGELDLQLPE